MLDTEGQPMRVAMAPWLHVELTGVSRLQSLLVPAIEQALEPIAKTGLPALRVGLALALPNARPGIAADLSASLMAQLGQRFSAIFRAAAVFPAGHAGGLLALDAAIKKLEEGEFDAFVVAGVDSYTEPETLEWLEACEQLHGAGPLNNAWGFVPGEGAGAVLVAKQAVAQRLQVAPLANVFAVGIGFESKRIKTETICIGEGLSQSFRAGLMPLGAGGRVSDVYCDMNGEPYRADEFGFAGLRTKDSFESLSDFIAPADCWGDVAAAGAALHIGLAAIAGAKGYSRGKVAFVWASSETGERAAVLVATN